MPDMGGQNPARKPTGRLEGALSKLFTRSATVREARTVAENFRLLTLSGPALQNVSWIPGQKVQLMLGGWVQRTYTPLSWDSESGVTRLLAYAHGAFPGSDWSRSLAAGEACSIFGPRGSLDLNALGRPAVLFGDETSFGLAYALRHTPSRADAVHILLEVTSLEVAQTALDATGVAGCQLVQRRADDSHLAEVEQIAAGLQQQHCPESWVLSGKAPSIQRLTRRLRELDVQRRRIQTKAYWAPGKVGLD
jgi:ferric-chelate reductase (NADPH)